MSTPLTRRVMVATAAAALLPLREAVAQAAAEGGDWMTMVRRQHALIAASFERLLASERRTFLQRERLMREIGYQLTAHSVAEENVLYPALAMAGMGTAADKLYLDQAHAKVMNAQLDMMLAARREGTDWLTAARTLQAAVLQHAKEDEEANLYPMLQQKLTPPQNADLARLFRREFDTVRPPRTAAA